MQFAEHALSDLLRMLGDDQGQQLLASPTETLELAPVEQPERPQPLPPGPTRRLPLGTVAGARSGDKGGGANIGVWVRTEAQWHWLANMMTAEKVRKLLPEAADLPVTVYLLPRIRALNRCAATLLGEALTRSAIVRGLAARLEELQPRDLRNPVRRGGGVLQCRGRWPGGDDHCVRRRSRTAMADSSCVHPWRENRRARSE